MNSERDKTQKHDGSMVDATRRRTGHRRVHGSRFASRSSRTNIAEDGASNHIGSEPARVAHDLKRSPHRVAQSMFSKFENRTGTLSYVSPGSYRPKVRPVDPTLRINATQWETHTHGVDIAVYQIFSGPRSPKLFFLYAGGRKPGPESVAAPS